MAKETVGLGTLANDGTGDTLRSGGTKINSNFTEIYTAFGDGSTLSSLAVTALNNPTANELVTVGSTTTELEQVIHDLSLMNAMESYFSFKCQTDCGIQKSN